MPLNGSASCSSLPAGGGSVAQGLAARMRSASPHFHGALASDMRRLASSFQLDTSTPGGGSTPVKPSSDQNDRDRGSYTNAQTLLGAARLAAQQQLGPLAERVDQMVAHLQGQCEKCEADRRRMTQLERRLEARLEERSKEADGRERWAETQGSVSGLIDELQALRLRVDGLDERLYARTSGSDVAKQRSRELEQQVQVVEHQSRLHISAVEDVQRRQVARLKRTESCIEEATRRINAVEEEVRSFQSQCRRSGDPRLETRLGMVEEQLKHADNAIRCLQVQVADGVKNAPDNSQDLGGDIHEAVRTSDRERAAFEKRASGQIQDLSASIANMKVKVDGQLHRIGTLADRLETAHEPAVEALRAELNQVRTQDQHRLEGELATLRNLVQETAETSEEAVEGLRETIAEIREAFQRTVSDSPAYTALDERFAELEAKLNIVSSHTVELSSQLINIDHEDKGAASPCMMNEVHSRVGPPLHSVPESARSNRNADWGSSVSRHDGLRHELETVADQLKAADYLARRVAKLEEQVAGGRLDGIDLGSDPGSGGSDTASAMVPRPPRQLYSLSREVSELQAKLLASQLNLQTSGSDTSEQDVETRHEISILSARIREMEQEFAEQSSRGMHDSVGALCDLQCDDTEPNLAYTLMTFACQLEPLQGVFQELSKHMVGLRGGLKELQTSPPDASTCSQGNCHENSCDDELSRIREVLHDLSSRVSMDLGDIQPMKDKIAQTWEAVKECTQDLQCLCLRVDGTERSHAALRHDLDSLPHRDDNSGSSAAVRWQLNEVSGQLAELRAQVQAGMSPLQSMPMPSSPSEPRTDDMVAKAWTHPGVVLSPGMANGDGGSHWYPSEPTTHSGRQMGGFRARSGRLAGVG